MNVTVKTNGKKLLRLITVMIAVTAMTFLIVDLLPGDVSYEIAGDGATPDEIESIQEELGLNEPIFVRYCKWLMLVLQGDLGKSLKTGEPVLGTIVSRLPVTLELMVLSQVFALALAIPLGIFCAYRSRTWIDTAVSSTAFGMMSIPVFVMGIVLIYVFAIQLKWLPATGYTPLSESIVKNLQSFILPSFSIALVEWVSFMRVLRSDMISTLQEDFILMARSKGLPDFYILLHHALRPSSLTLVTILGIHIGHLIGGSLIVEMIFALPGIGRLLIGSIFSRDYTMVQGCILMITVAYVLINAMVDKLYFLLDPPIRRTGTV